MGVLMIRYIVLQIEQGKLKYDEVLRKYPGYKEDIDKILKDDGMYNLIVE